MIPPRHGPRSKHNLSIAVEVCLPRRYIGTVATRATENTVLLFSRVYVAGVT
jgi:hypothetical protein